MRILLLAPQPFFSDRGTPIAERGAVEALCSAGHRVDVLAYSQGDALDLPGARVHRCLPIPGVGEVPPGFSWGKALSDVPLTASALRLSGRNQYDVVHAVEESVFTAQVLHRIRGLPYIYDMDSLLSRQLVDGHGWMRPFEPLFRRLEERAIRNSLAVLCVSPALRERVRRVAPGHLVGLVEDTTLLRDGGDPRPLEPTAGSGAADRSADLSELIGSEGPFILYVGNLSPYQGIDLLLEAFLATAPLVPDARIVLIGGRRERLEHYRKKAEAMGIGRHVHLLGPRPLPQLGHYLRQATVLASPRVKGMNTPLKLYSYMDSGVPVVATRLETHTQVLTDEVAALVEPDPEAFGRALARLLLDPAARDRLARAARKLVDREYSPAAFRRKMLAFYGQVEGSLRNGATAASGG